MGLDHGLRGHDTAEDAGHSLPLATWRKHSNLHGYVVKTFGGDPEDQAPIPLSEERLETFIAAVEAGALPHTEGFFFGASQMSPAERAEDLELLRDALTWLKGRDTRTVEYWCWW